VDINQLRKLWRSVDQARRKVEQATKSSHDKTIVEGAGGMALIHLKDALKLIEEIGKKEKR
jgi:hypothetical protein